MNPDGRWRLVVGDAVGLVSVGDLRVVVKPKIPRSHLFYLFSRSELLPRLAPTATAAAEGVDLWELVCRWFLDAAEQVIRRDLVRDYFPFRDILAAARGQIEPLATAERYYRGSLGLACAYEEFGSDTALNRVLKAGAETVMASADAAPETRRRAQRVAARMEGLSPLQANDLRAHTDRRTAHYRDAFILARAILLNVRRTLAHGDERAWTFLIRTPELVEAGVRAELQARLPDAWDVRKVTFPLRGANMTIAPDLVLGDVIAVGDVKYKRVLSRWRRADLYEVTAFATAAGVARAAVIGFRGNDDPDPPPPVGVGETHVRFFAWDARDKFRPSRPAQN